MPRGQRDGPLCRHLPARCLLSADNGTSWIAVNAGLPSGVQIRSLAADALRVFAGTDTAGVYVGNKDTGWTAANAGLPANAWVEALVASGSDLYACTRFGVFHSTDHGTSWTAIAAPTPDCEINCLALRGKTLYVGTSYDGIFATADNGKSWTAMGAAISAWEIDYLALSSKKLIAGTESGGFLFPRTTAPIGQRPIRDCPKRLGSMTSKRSARTSSPQRHAVHPGVPATAFTKAGYLFPWTAEPIGRRSFRD